MSNEPHSAKLGAPIPYVPHPPTFSTNSSKPWPDVFMPLAQPTLTGKLTVFGVEVGSADELAALVRDARRFRKLARFPSGKWGAVFHSMPLAELADALPEVER